MPLKGKQRFQMFLIAAVFMLPHQAFFIIFFHLIEIKFPISQLSGTVPLMELTVSIKVVEYEPIYSA